MIYLKQQMTHRKCTRKQKSLICPSHTSSPSRFDLLAVRTFTTSRGCINEFSFLFIYLFFNIVYTCGKPDKCISLATIQCNCDFFSECGETRAFYQIQAGTIIKNYNPQPKKKKKKNTNGCKKILIKQFKSLSMSPKLFYQCCIKINHWYLFKCKSFFKELCDPNCPLQEF